MSALITPLQCLMIKAAYLFAVSVASWRSIKSQCLTFGQFLVASSFDKDARIHNECLLNAGAGNRHRVSHTCHEHRKDREPSPTGDSIGHCQKCTKFNTMDKAQIWSIQALPSNIQEVIAFQSQVNCTCPNHYTHDLLYRHASSVCLPCLRVPVNSRDVQRALWTELAGWSVWGPLYEFWRNELSKMPIWNTWWIQL